MLHIFFINRIFKTQKLPAGMFFVESCIQVFMTCISQIAYVRSDKLEQKHIQKQPSRIVLSKRCSGNMQQIYRGTCMLKCHFNKLKHGCSPVNLLHIFKTLFPKNTSRGLLLQST